jgi:hypothetical protein
MAEVSKVWLEAQKEIEEFKEAFEKRYGFGLSIHMRNSTLINIPPISLNDVLEEVDRLFYEMYPSGIVKSSYGTVHALNGIRSKTRVHEVVVMRQIFSYIALELGYAFTEIGRFLNMNHSTIIAAKKSLEISFVTNYNGACDKYQAVKSSILIKFGGVNE